MLANCDDNLEVWYCDVMVTFAGIWVRLCEPFCSGSWGRTGEVCWGVCRGNSDWGPVALVHRIINIWLLGWIRGVGDLWRRAGWVFEYR